MYMYMYIHVYIICVFCRGMVYVYVLCSAADFMVPPSQLADDDETEDNISLSGSNYGGFSFLQSSAPSSRSPSPDLSFMSEANAAAAAWKADKHTTTTSELLPQSSGTLPQKKSNPHAMRKSGSYDLVAISRHRALTMPSQERSSHMARKSAMSGDKKRDMEELRRRVIEKKRAGEQQRQLSGDSHSATLSLEPVKMKRSRSNDLPVMSSRVSPAVGSSPHPHIKVSVATPPALPEVFRGEPRSVSPLTEAMIAPEPKPKPTVPATVASSSPAGATGIDNDTPPFSQQPDSTTGSLAESKKRKPVPSPRRKLGSFDSDPQSSTITAQQQQQQQQQQASSHEPVEFKRIVTSNIEGRKYGTLEREKKPSAAPRKRTASLDKEKSREYRSGTLERKKRAAKTPEPQASDSNTTAPPSKKISLGISKSSVDSNSPPSIPSVVPYSMTREQGSVYPQTSMEVSPRVKEEVPVEPPNPTLREIGKTVSIGSEGSGDSRGGAEVTRDHVESETVLRTDSGGAEDHKWQRKGARRAGGRQRRGHPMHQDEVEDEESNPRSRTRSGAVSGGAARRSHQNTAEEDDQHSSRSRTRSGAVSGSDKGVIRRSRNVKGSARPSARAGRRPHSGGSYPEKDGVDFPEPQFQTDPHGLEEAEIMHRSRVSRQRRAARTGGDLLVASDGEQD